MKVYILRFSVIIGIILIPLLIIGGIMYTDLYKKEVVGVSTVAVQNEDRPVVILDAGHGGLDGGAVSPGGLCEKGINLQIALKTEAILRLFGVQTVLTRREDASLHSPDARTVRAQKVSDLKYRASFYKQFKNPFFVSIHLNNFNDQRYSGAQVFYSSNNNNSRDLAITLQKSMIMLTNGKNKRIAKKATDEVYIMNNIKCPAVIVECGFLSNPREERLLKTPEYQTKLAMAIASGYCNFESETQRTSENES